MSRKPELIQEHGIQLAKVAELLKTEPKRFNQPNEIQRILEDSKPQIVSPGVKIFASSDALAKVFEPEVQQSAKVRLRRKRDKIGVGPPSKECKAVKELNGLAA